MCFRVMYKIKQRTELQFVPFRALLFLFNIFRAESDLRFNLDGPALGIRQLTPLDTGQGIVQLLVSEETRLICF